MADGPPSHLAVREGPSHEADGGAAGLLLRKVAEVPRRPTAEAPRERRDARAAHQQIVPMLLRLRVRQGVEDVDGVGVPAGTWWISPRTRDREKHRDDDNGQEILFN